MDTNDILLKLSSAYQDFIFHERFWKELEELLQKELSGKHKNFFKVFLNQLNNIKSFGCMINTVDGHEIIKGMDGHYYSIHIEQRSKFNVRLLIHIDDSSNVRFLCAFYERGGKKNTDYTKHKEVLERRLQDLMLGVDNNG